jgi:hypothetical protein
MSNTVTITLTDDEYAQLKKLAEEQDRYISAQARHMLRDCLREIAEIERAYELNAGRYRDTHAAGAGSEPEAPIGGSFEIVSPDTGPDSTLGEQQRVQPPLGPPLTGELGKEPLPG